jgi:lysozyme
VGWGHRLAAGEVPQETTAGLEILFIRDLAEALAGADAFIQHSPHKDKLHPAAFGIVLEMAFNLGFPRLIQFKKFREAIFALDYRAAAREMLDSRWAGQVGPRARRLAKLMEGLARVTG